MSGDGKPAAGGGLRVLLVEDEPVARMAATLLLKRLGHQVEAVADGPAALSTLQAGGGCDLLLLDLGLPGLDGDEVARRVRTLPLSGPAPRILILTATAVAADLERCRSCGADGVLQKPLTPELLASALRGMAPLRETAAQDASQDASQDKAFDPSVFAVMRESLPAERVATLIAKTAATLAQYRATLEAARTAGDRTAVAAMAHKIAGVAGIYGCAALRRAAQRLEATATSEAAEAAYREMDAAFGPALSWLETMAG
ncbi:response regulator [Azospirillum thermophilum]|uniref:Response regulator n=1 Tax=Azospirillum thermophilum TaxID=2202148 RepID=A0A2S2CPQ3_9PROT|nr:response regulator [Azospirillum thermophilum]AWK86462.1 response regulator [Azospirillum thermophilum]